jgi:hypothetical protein
MAIQTIKARLKFVRKTTAQWAAETRILLEGEPAIEVCTDGTEKEKRGNGVSLWAALPYLSGGGAGTQGPAGPAGPQGPAGVVAATAPLTYDAPTQTVAISAATTSAAGSMSAADKAKLDGIAAADAAPLALAATAAVGTSTDYAREDHAHQRDSDVIVVPVGDESTALTTGTNRVRFRMPFAATLLAVRANVNTAPTGSTLIVDINEGGTSVLGTKLSIDATETSSTTAASAATITDSSLADDAEISIDIDQIGSTVAGAGLKVSLFVRRA